MILKIWLAAASVVLVWFFAAPWAKAQSADAASILAYNPFAVLQQTTSPNGSTPGATSDPASQTLPAQSKSTEEEERKTAEEQLKQEEQHRVFGVMAAFNTTANREAVPLSVGQKFRLFFKSATDPWAYLLSAAGAGIDQADNSFEEYGQGMQGYAKRFGANYTDYFTGNFFGNAVLTSLFREDPRYFQKGTGSFARRALWAASGTVWCKRDSGTWGPNYANVMGNLIGASLSNLYYPEADRTARGTLERGFTVTAQGIIGSEVIEFWPDMVRHHRRKQAEKLARQAAQKGAQNAPQPAAQSAPAPPPSKPQD